MTKDDQVKDVFVDIVNFSKKNGCPVTVYNELENVNGSNGYFCCDPSPHIKVAIKNKTWKKALELVIHEFCHYWQWKDGFLGRKDDEGNIIYSQILDGKEVTPSERDKASKLVRISEYDCEIRTASLLDKWKLEFLFPTSEHIKSSNTYNRHIVWSIGDSAATGSGVFLATYDNLANKLWGKTVFNYFWNPKTPEGRDKLLEPLSAKHKKVFDEALKRSNKKLHK